MKPMLISLTPANQDDDGICQLQTLGGAGNMTINGALSIGPYDASSCTLNSQTRKYLKVGRQVAIASTGNISAVTFTITGTDENGVSITDAVVGPNNSTVTSVKYFNTVSQIAASGAVGTNTKVGTNGGVVTQMLPLNVYSSNAPTINVECTGTITSSIQECFNRVLESETPLWQNVPSLTSVVVASSVPAATNASGTQGAAAVRFKSTTYTNGATVKVLVNTPRSL